MEKCTEAGKRPKTVFLRKPVPPFETLRSSQTRDFAPQENGTGCHEGHGFFSGFCYEREVQNQGEKRPP
jgi:hypothetical protein